MSLNINQIRIDGGTQSRAAINDATVAEYAEAMADPVTVFPPVIVYFDGKEYWLADGFHRLAAWAQIGRTEIPTEIRQGDRRRAILHSVAANSAHGLRRTNEDKRRAVLTLLEDDEWGQWSDREIARRCAVDHKTVGKLRGELTGEIPSEEPRTFTTKHGTQATMNTANIGAASKPDQEAKAPETPAIVAPEVKQEADPVRSDQEPAAPAAAEEEIPAEVAAVMHKHSGLTREALLRDYAELVVEAKAERAKAKEEIAELKTRLAELTDDDKDGVIRSLQAKVKNADSAKWRATEEQRVAMKQVYVLKKRVAELESMEVSL